MNTNTPKLFIPVLIPVLLSQVPSHSFEVDFEEAKMKNVGRKKAAVPLTTRAVSDLYLPRCSSAYPH